MFEVTFADFAAIGFLIFLEGILSLDNALVLALIVSPLPEALRKKALLYGIVGAIVFRIVAISLASHLIEMNWVKFVGGGYLLYLSCDFAFKHFTKTLEQEKAEEKAKHRSFWMTVIVVELTDIAFAIDSILTAVALTKKVWVVITGGVIGLFMMRFAASIFIKLLEKFPRFEATAYMLVFLIGAKLVIEGFHLPYIDFHSPSHPAFWIFWGIMMLSFLSGFFKKPRKN